MGRFARNRPYAASQGLAERLLLTAPRGLPFLKNLPFDRDAVALAASQRGDQLSLFLREVFLGIDAPVDGEPALVRHHVEVGTTAALSSQHQDGVAHLICPDMETGSFLLHLSLQFLKPLNDLTHPFERVLALVLQADVRRFPEHPNAQRNGPAVRVPHRSAGRLCQQHADTAAAQSSLCRQPCRAPFASRLFVGNQRQRNAPVESCSTIPQRENGIEHRNNPALHVARSAAKQKMASAQRLKLLPRLCWNNIVMSVKVENAFSPSVTGNQTNGTLARAAFQLTGFQALTFETTLPQSIFKKVRARAIIFPRRILRRYLHQLCQQRSHLVLALSQPFQKLIGAHRIRSFGHATAC